MNTIADKTSQDSHVANGAAPAPVADPPPHLDAPATAADGSLPVTEPQSAASAPPVHRYRKWLMLAGIVAALVLGGRFLIPLISTALNTVSTEDAYINGHVTLV